MSAPWTTSKTALMVKQRRAAIEQSLCCYLCKGLLIDAVTIGECMDSFCKSCIVKFLATSSKCPKCNLELSKTNPNKHLRSDKVLQDIVYKLISGLYDEEMKRRREFYSDSLESIENGDSNNKEDDSNPALTQSSILRRSSEQYGIVPHPKPFYQPADTIDVSIEPLTHGNSHTVYYDQASKSIFTCFENESPSKINTRNSNSSSSTSLNYALVSSKNFKSYLRCPAMITSVQLKRLIYLKFNLTKDDSVNLLYLNERLCDDYSLIDIAYIYDWKGVEPMKLFFNIERKKCIPGSSNQINQNLKRNSESIGTSNSSPSKRVCINPEPHFLEAKNSKQHNKKSKTEVKYTDATTTVKLKKASVKQAPSCSGSISKSSSASKYDVPQVSSGTSGVTSSIQTTTTTTTRSASLAFVPVTSLSLKTSSKNSFVNTNTPILKPETKGPDPNLRSLRSTKPQEMLLSPTNRHSSPIAKININLNTMTSSFAVEQRTTSSSSNIIETNSAGSSGSRMIDSACSNNGKHVSPTRHKQQQYIQQYQHSQTQPQYQSQMQQYQHRIHPVTIMPSTSHQTETTTTTTIKQSSHTTSIGVNPAAQSLPKPNGFGILMKNGSIVCPTLKPNSDSGYSSTSTLAGSISQPQLAMRFVSDNGVTYLHKLDGSSISYPRQMLIPSMPAMSSSQQALTSYHNDHPSTSSMSSSTANLARASTSSVSKGVTSSTANIKIATANSSGKTIHEIKPFVIHKQHSQSSIHSQSTDKIPTQAVASKSSTNNNNQLQNLPTITQTTSSLTQIQAASTCSSQSSSPGYSPPQSHSSLKIFSDLNNSSSSPPSASLQSTSSTPKPHPSTSSSTSSSTDPMIRQQTSLKNLTEFLPRPHLKVKPVYKTFVDPTKIKTPNNIKKLGHTARH